MATRKNLITEAEAQRERFHNTCGAIGYMSVSGPMGANHHPDRCVCQGDDTIPHKHYREPPYSCARCLKCKAYKPAVPTSEAVANAALADVRAALGCKP